MIKLNLVEKAYAEVGINSALKEFLGISSTEDAVNADLNSITDTIGNVTQLALDLAGIVAFIMILYASIVYLTSYGDESRAEIAKKTLIWSVIGLAVIVFSKTILLIVYNNLLV